MKFLPTALAVLALLPATANAQTYTREHAANALAARVDAINNAPITQAAWNKYASGVRVLPPVQYDVPYRGRLIITEAPDMASTPALCNMTVAKAACAWRRLGECEVIMVPLDALRAMGHAPRIVLRHELGHCLSWPATHEGMRAVPP